MQTCQFAVDVSCRGNRSPPPPGTVKFIDYEYADYNYQAFDIGNHFNEFAGERSNQDANGRNDLVIVLPQR